MDALGFCFCFAQCGQKHACENGDNCDYHQQFDQREPASARPAPGSSALQREKYWRHKKLRWNLGFIGIIDTGQTGVNLHSRGAFIEDDCKPAALATDSSSHVCLNQCRRSLHVSVDRFSSSHLAGEMEPGIAQPSAVMILPF